MAEKKLERVHIERSRLMEYLNQNDLRAMTGLSPNVSSPPFGGLEISPTSSMFSIDGGSTTKSYRKSQIKSFKENVGFRDVKINPLLRLGIIGMILLKAIQI